MRDGEFTKRDCVIWVEWKQLSRIASRASRSKPRNNEAFGYYLMGVANILCKTGEQFKPLYKEQAYDLTLDEAREQFPRIYLERLSEIQKFCTFTAHDMFLMFPTPETKNMAKLERIRKLFCKQ